jgi:hypothetical protein
MSKKNILYETASLTAMLLMTFNAYCGSNPQAQTLMHGLNRDFSFTENKGQLADEKGNLLSDISYYGKSNGVAVYYRSNKLSFVFMKVEGGRDLTTFKKLSNQAQPVMEVPTTITAARMDMEFVGASPNPQLTSENAQPNYTNYFLAHTGEKGLTNIKSYKKLTYRNIYPNIDLLLETGKTSEVSSGMEYSFIVHPGGNVNDIQIKWSGVDTITNKTSEVSNPGGIHYSNSLGYLDESAAVFYQPAEGKAIQSLVGMESQDNEILSLKGIESLDNNNTLSFKIANYDKSKDLIIDPGLSWATYYGGSNKDYGQGIATDASGNVYITGFTLSTSGIATTGAYKTSGGGAYCDAFLAKFSSSGSLYWATYYGGSNFDYGNGVATDASGNVYITGNTQSSSGIATSGAYQTLNAGREDVFLAKFSSSGSLYWATYYGGRDEDFGQGVATDATGNVYITGYTFSTSGIATSSAYKTSGGGTYNDALLAKFSSSGSLSWATYYGGSDQDFGKGVAIDTSGNVYITGYTFSTSGIATSSAYQTSNAGNYDVFLAKFSSSGTLSWATYYGGSDFDLGYGVAMDGSGNVFITGYTHSTSGIATSGAYKTSGGGAYEDAFLAKFSSSGSLSWATYYGGKDFERGNGVATDVSGNVYITGNTQSTSGIATSGAYQTLNAGYEDVFLAKFSSSGSLSWATYYGGKDYDRGFGVATYASGNIYITGFTLSDSEIATSGAYQTSYAAGGYIDAFLSKFSFPLKNDAGISSIDSLASSFCATIKNVYTTINNAGSDTLTSATINWKVNGISQKAYSWTGLLALGSSSYVNIGTYNFTTIGTNTIKAWTSIPNGSIDSFPFNDTTIMKVIVDSLPGIPHWTAKNLGNRQYSFLANDTTLPATAYAWNFGDGTSAKGYKATHTYTKDSAFTVQLTVTNSNNCTSFFDSTLKIYTGISEINSDIFNLNIYPNPFKDQTTLEYYLGKAANIKILIYSVDGKLVTSLTDERQEPGKYQFVFKPDANISPGLYLMRIILNDKSILKQIIRIK